MHVWMRGEEVFDRIAFVSGQVVHDDVDLLPAGLVDHDVGEEGDDSAEVCRAAVLPSTSPVLVLKGAYRDKGAMAEVLKAVSFRSARGERQHRVLTIQGLDCSLLIMPGSRVRVPPFPPMTYARFRPHAVKSAWRFRGTPQSDWPRPPAGRFLARCSG